MRTLPVTGMFLGTLLLLTTPLIEAQQPPSRVPPPQVGEAPAGQAPATGGLRPGMALPPAGQSTATPGAGVPAPARTPFPPLSAQQQAELDRILSQWEGRSSQITTLECEFIIWEYNNAFNARTERSGVIKYKRPDKGLYHVMFQKTDAQPGQQPKWNRLDGEHWICNGESIYEFRHEEKQVIQHNLPEELRGEGIQHGPLPFLFVAEAQHLKKRYWLRDITTPKDREKGQIWLEAYPRYQQDAANFRKAELILTQADFLPYGLKLYLPDGKSHTTHVFTKYNINKFDPIFWRDEFNPNVPDGYQLKVEEALAPASEVKPRTPQPAANNPSGGLFNQIFRRQ